jgi:hypothetical protein
MCRKRQAGVVTSAGPNAGKARSRWPVITARLGVLYVLDPRDSRASEVIALGARRRYLTPEPIRWVALSALGCCPAPHVGNITASIHMASGWSATERPNGRHCRKALAERVSPGSGLSGHPFLGRFTHRARSSRMTSDRERPSASAFAKAADYSRCHYRLEKVR